MTSTCAIHLQDFKTAKFAAIHNTMPYFIIHLYSVA